MARRRKKSEPQGAFEFPNGWGGKRRGAGAKQKGQRARVKHAKREEFAERFPVHVTMKLRSGLPSMRRAGACEVLLRAFGAMRERAGFRLVHYSIQSNHLHLVCEALGRGELVRGIQALATRIAKGLNALWKRAGRLFADRYHDHVLRTPREVRNALAYVLNNAAHHGVSSGDARPDLYSSGRWFEAWRTRVTEQQLLVSPLSRARTWLLSIGWSRHGPIEQVTGDLATAAP